MTQEIIFSSISTLMACFFLTLILTGLIKSVLVKRAVLDIPNDRSSHKIAVPRGGGWALLVILLPALVGAMVYYDNNSMRHVGLLVGLIILAGISWLDDRKHVGAGIRLSAHILAACLGSFAFAPHELLFGGELPFWLDRTLMILGWAWFINVYNFMDGIDGITGVETISIATGMCFVMVAAGIDNQLVELLTLLLAGCCLGFLVHNWHPAKIFLGDIGSVPLGYLVGFCLLTLAVTVHDGTRSWAAALILPMYYLADTSITIVKRAVRGEKIWQAHRQHFYQKAAQKAGTHDKVVFMVAAANLVLMIVAIFSIVQPYMALALSVVVVLALMAAFSRL